MPTRDHALCTVPGRPLLEQTAPVWSVAELRCRGSITCQRLSLHARVSLGPPGSPPPPSEKKALVLHKFGISAWCAEPSTTDGRGGELGVQCAGLGLFHSIFRLISLTRTPQGLVSLVISSTCGSIVAASGRAKQRRKKDRGGNGCNHDPPPCSHHRRMTGSAMSGAGDSLKHLNSEKLQKQTPAIYICIKRASLSIQVT